MHPYIMKAKEFIRREEYFG